MASLKTEFNQFAKNNYLKLEYKTIYKRLKNILRNSANPEQDLKKLWHDMNVKYKNRSEDEDSICHP